jgi:hypothetical protein
LVETETLDLLLDCSYEDAKKKACLSFPTLIASERVQDSIGLVVYKGYTCPGPPDFLGPRTATPLAPLGSGLLAFYYLFAELVHIYI